MINFRFRTVAERLTGCVRRLTATLIIFACFLFATAAQAQQSVEQWKKFETSIQNSSWSGNPFDVVLTATFTHTNSGESKTQFGFYAGSNTWTIYFMPDLLGNWTYTTSSSDSDLNGVNGAFIATPPSISGSIRPGNTHWRLDTGEAVAPTILAVGPFVRSRTLSETQGLVDWANQVAGATYLGTTLLNFSGDAPYTESQEDRMYLDSNEGEEFYLPAWNRSNDFYDAARDANMGHYILIYSDDGSAPSSHGLPEGADGTIGAAEERLFRYLVARFAPYPKVMWDSGIDIGENRSNTWLNNFVAWFHANDPWVHPISSRTGGGSGGIDPPLSDFYSDGLRILPNWENQLLTDVQSRGKPVAYTDRYRENYSSPFAGDRHQVREAVWEMAMAWGTGVYIGGSEFGGYLGSTYATDLEVAPDMGVLRSVLDNQIQDFDNLVPDTTLKRGPNDIWVTTNGTSEYFCYVRRGAGGDPQLALVLGADTFHVNWIDPGDGSTQTDITPTITGSSTFTFTRPGINSLGQADWALHIVRDGKITRSEAITDLIAR